MYVLFIAKYNELKLSSNETSSPIAEISLQKDPDKRIYQKDQKSAKCQRKSHRHTVFGSIMLVKSFHESKSQYLGEKR